MRGFFLGVHSDYILEVQDRLFWFNGYKPYNDHYFSRVTMVTINNFGELRFCGRLDLQFFFLWISGPALLPKKISPETGVILFKLTGSWCLYEIYIAWKVGAEVSCSLEKVSKVWLIFDGNVSSWWAQKTRQYILRGTITYLPFLNGTC